MLHLALISIACAVSALSEGTALIGLKKKEPHFFCQFAEEHFEGPTRPYNVDVNDFDCASRKISNRTSSFFYQFIINQYQNNMRFCSSMETVFPERKEKQSSNIFAFRKRRLLWSEKNPQMKNTTAKSHKRKTEKKKKVQKPNSLCGEEKKKFLRLKRIKHKRTKRSISERYLDNLEVDDELNINKRIEKLVKKIAVENQRTEESSRSESAIAERDGGKRGPATGVGGSFPFLRNFKKIFRFSKDSINSDKRNKVRVSSVPVNIVRRQDPLADVSTRISSYNVLKPRRETISRPFRFRRNLPRNYDSSPMQRCRKKLNPRHSLISANSDNFLLNQNRRRIILGERRERRKRKGKSGERSIGRKNWPLFRRPKYNHESKSAALYQETNNRRNATATATEREEFDSGFGDSVEKNGGNEKEGARNEGNYGRVVSSRRQNLEKARELDYIEETLEKPVPGGDLVETELNVAKFPQKRKMRPPAIAKPPVFYREKNDDLDSSLEECLSHSRYLKFRRALRNFLMYNNLPIFSKRSLRFERLKRCGSKCGALPHKCWRSAPLLCIPYIRRGQDELLKYLIKTLQTMLGKPFPQKVDIFEKTKYKPCNQKTDRTCEDIMPNDEANTCQTPAPQCAPQPPPTPCPPTTTPCPPTTTPCPPTTTPCPPTTAPCPPTPSLCPFATTLCPPAQCPPKPCDCSTSLVPGKDYPLAPNLVQNPGTYCSPGSNPVPSASPGAPAQPPATHAPAFSTATPPRATSYSSQPHASPLPPPMRPSYRSNPGPYARGMTPVTPAPGQYASPSAVSSCSWFFSKSPIEQSEYFSFTAFPCNAVPGCPTSSHSTVPLSPQPQSMNALKGYSSADAGPTPCKACSLSVENTTPWAPPYSLDSSSRRSSNALPARRPFDYRLPREEKVKSSHDVIDEFQHMFPDYFTAANRAKHNGRKLVDLNGKKRGFKTRNNLPLSSLRSDDLLGYEQANSKNHKYAKKRHREPSKSSFESFMTFSPESETDTDYQDGYPFIKFIERIPPREYPMLWPRYRDMRRKIKKSARRQKRGDDYYSSPENVDSYEDYVYDPIYGDQYPSTRLLNSSLEEDLAANEEPSDYDPDSPPSFANMFKELAKNVTASEVTIQDTTESFQESDSSTADAITESISIAVTTQAAEEQVVSSSVSGVTSPPSESPQSKREESKSSSGTSPTTETPDKELDAEEGEEKKPTTLKTAIIVKGEKKLFTKPSPKIYTKVYPDSLANESEIKEQTTTSLATSNPVEKSTVVLTSSKPDFRLQLLAVCEGYLEVVKLIRAQNLSLVEELDADLSRYCENIISQSFNFPSDSSAKPKKMEPPTVSATPKITADTVQETNSLNSDLKYGQLTNGQLLGDSPYKRGSAEVDIREEQKTSGRGKRKRKIKQRSSNGNENQKRYQRKEDSEDKLLKKGMSDEQVQLLQLLRKRKRALLSWLYNSKDGEIKPEDFQETEYFDDENCVNDDSELTDTSGTVTPKGNQERIGSTVKPQNDRFFVNESIYPVYAKEYGYDKGGEIREVEVFWRKVNEKTHEKKVFKNLSVLALFLTSTSAPNVQQADTRLVANGGYDNEEISEISKSENKVGFAEPAVSGDKTEKTDSTATVATAVTQAVQRDNSSAKNDTYTVMSKPDPSSIVGTPPNATTAFPNATHKPSHKLGAAKDFFQEYTIEFLNYAVYILPIMFTLLFLFCCMCCFLQILKNKKRERKRRKKKKKKEISTEDDTESTEESEVQSKKKKRREGKHRKQSKKDPDGETLSKERSKNIWNVLKLNSAKPSSEFNDETIQNEKKSFLRFLKSKKDEGKEDELSSLQYTPLRELDEQSKKFSESEVKKTNDYDDQFSSAHNNSEKGKVEKPVDEAKERRELIALLEELKKIETENTGERKEQKSVHVQYMFQEEDNSPFRSPQRRHRRKETFGVPENLPRCKKHFSFYDSDTSAVENYEMYEDVGELTELIPCECEYFQKRKDHLRRSDFHVNREGRCERFFKIFRDSGGCHKNRFKEMDFIKRDKNYLVDKNKSISTIRGGKLYGGTRKNAGTEISLTDNLMDDVSPFSLTSKKKNDILLEMENLKRQLNKNNYVRLKDNGVLCRL